MKKKATVKARTAKSGSKAKSGKKYSCDVCGMVVAVERDCRCDACDMICCGKEYDGVGLLLLI